MRVAVLHSFYASGTPSGENHAVHEQTRALADSGHEVFLLSRSTDLESHLPLYSVRVGLRQVTGIGPDPIPRLQAFSPDIVHVHNLFPNIGTRWLTSWPGPIVHTIHNFRSLCSNGLLFRDGHSCRDCLDSGPLQAIKHGCYRDSRFATLPVALGPARGAERNALLRRADALVCLSDSARAVFADQGVDQAKLAVIPNGISGGSGTALDGRRGAWLLVGRLSSEKGVLELLESWPDSERLDIIGAGPLESEVRSRLSSNVRLLGSLEHGSVLTHMRRAKGLMFPSRCFEMQPTVVMEAMSVGLPVVAFSGNSVADLIMKADIGCSYSDQRTLCAALDYVSRARDRLSGNCLTVFGERFSVKAWATTMSSLYQSLLNR